jgi:hypothetical protein
MYTGELHFITMDFFKSFALFRHRTSKKSLFSLKGDRNKNVQKEISFYSQGLHQFSPASASILCKGSAVLRSYRVLMGTMTLCHTTQAIEIDQSFQLKNLYAPQGLFTGLPGGRSCQREREGSSPIPLERKRTLPNRRIHSRVIYYACSL